MSAESRLEALGIVLPEPPKPVANYVTVKRAGSFVYTTGSSCFEGGRFRYVGKLGQDLTVEQGYDAARLTVLNLLSQIRAEISSLDNVEQVVKLVGFVNRSPYFYQQPQVVNGASDLLVEIFGERGFHARSAVGVNVLPMNVPVEIELIVKVRE